LPGLRESLAEANEELRARLGKKSKPGVTPQSPPEPPRP
jgi:hypothetical protein